MAPVVKLYWLITLLLLPLSAGWVLSSSGGSLALDHLTDAPLALTVFLACLAWALIGGYELLFCISNLRRNYPVLANIRYALEYIRLSLIHI